MVLDFNILCIDGKAKADFGLEKINYLTEHFSFDRNLQHVKKARVLVDFLNPKHRGLSLRVFEALCYDKKLVTTNDSIAEYDFYHPDNILIWDGVDLSGLAAFLAKPYHALDADIKAKYGFESWIRYGLDIEPYQAITY